MSGIYAIGTKVFSDDGTRFFAHQFGDGFVIVADFHEPNLDRCAAIAIALMRQVAKSGCMARAAIAEGEFADVSGLWPKVIREAQIQDGGSDFVSIGSGLMTLLPVMGTALINANKLDAHNPCKGAILSIATKNACRVSPSFPRKSVKSNDAITVIDWVHATSPILEEIKSESGIGSDCDSAKSAVLAYIANRNPPPQWIEDTIAFNSIS